MLTSKQFTTELARGDFRLSPSEVHELTERFGNKVLQMGHLQDDGGLLVPMDCIVEAALFRHGNGATEVEETISSGQIALMLESDELMVDRVAEAGKRKLGEMVERFQSEPSDAKAHEDWKEIEKTIFGIEYMPYIHWTSLPREVRNHLEDRARTRQLTRQDLIRLRESVLSNPEVAEGQCCKDFGSFKLVGEGAVPKTFLTKDQACLGQRL